MSSRRLLPEYDWAGEAGRSRLMYVAPEGFVARIDAAIAELEQAAAE